MVLQEFRRLIEWWVFDEFTRRRRISLLHYRAAGLMTVCGVHIPVETSTAIGEDEIQNLSMVCRRCRVANERAYQAQKGVEDARSGGNDKGRQITAQ